MSTASRGSHCERKVKQKLEQDDWWVGRVTGSLGEADLVALKLNQRSRLIEVKATVDGPYKTFGPEDRQELSLAAKIAGAEAWLVWWPPGGTIHWIPESAWPVPKRLRLVS